MEILSFKIMYMCGQLLFIVVVSNLESCHLQYIWICWYHESLQAIKDLVSMMQLSKYE